MISKKSLILQKIDFLMSQIWFFDIIKLISWYRKFWRILYNKIAFVVSKHVEFSIDEMMTPMQKKKKKNAGVFPIPADSKFTACALIKLFTGAIILLSQNDFWYHKINFWCHKFGLWYQKIDLMLGYNKIDFLIWHIRFLDFTKSILWYKNHNNFVILKFNLWYHKTNCVITKTHNDLVI